MAFVHKELLVCRQCVIHRPSHSILILVSTLLLWSRLLLSSTSSLMLQNTTKNSKSTHQFFLQIKIPASIIYGGQCKSPKAKTCNSSGATLVWVVWSHDVLWENKEVSQENNIRGPWNWQKYVSFTPFCHRGTAKDFECRDKFTLTHKTERSLNQSLASAVSLILTMRVYYSYCIFSMIFTLCVLLLSHVRGTSCFHQYYEIYVVEVNIHIKRFRDPNDIVSYHIKSYIAAHKQNCIVKSEVYGEPI